MDEILSPDESAFVAQARDFARDRVAPFVAEWERRREFPRDAFREGARLGLTGLLVAKDLGGVALSHVAMARVLEELAGASLAFGFTLFVQHNVLAGIVQNGTRAQIDRFVPAMLQGERIGAFCLTEPGCGSDAAAIATTARRKGDGWRLDGEKAWVTNGAVADIFSVYARADESRDWRGIACFLIEEPAAGLRRGAPYALMGAHVMATNGISLDGCEVPADALLLGPGYGFKGAMAGINRARTAIAAMCCGMLRASLAAAVGATASRRAFGRPVAGFQGLQFELADVATDLEAARRLAYRAAWLLDRGEKAIVEAAHAKKFATRAALTGISTCMRAMGATGFRADHGLGRHLADAQMCQYLDGTDEIQNVVIGRALFGGRSIDAE